jgi:transposase
LDCHKRFIEVASVTKPSKIADESYHIRTDTHAIRAFARKLSPKDSLVLENTGSAHSIATLLKANTKAKITISNPMQTKMITASKKKTDKVDALALANLMAANYVPVVWQPSADIVALRRLVAYYCSIRRQKVLIKNRILGILQRNLVCDPPFFGKFGKKGRRYLLNVVLPMDEKEQVKEDLSLLEHVEGNMLAIKKRIAVRVVDDAVIRRLMTITGIDMLGAVSLKAAIGNDISRFPSPKKLVSYLGLGCSISQSADRCYIGRISKRGNVFARCALVQTAQTLVKYPSPIRAFFQRLYQKKGRNKAIIAVANKLTRIVWHMLTNGEDYRYQSPVRTRMKLTRLKFLASGQYKKGGRMTKDIGIGKKAERQYKAFIKKRLGRGR